MAIEIPNQQHAAATVNVDFEDPPVALTPFVSQNGFQAFDPTSNPGGDDLENLRGGWTKLGTGNYAMRTTEGADPLEVIYHMVIGSGLQALASAIPNLPSLLGGLGDGFTAIVNIFETDGGAPADSDYQVQAFRYNTGPQLGTLST